MSDTCELLGIEKLRTIPFRPQTNGCTERYNQTLGGLLRRYVADNGSDWDKVIPGIVLAYHSTVHQSTGYSPFYLMHGRHPKAIIDINFPMSEHYRSHRELAYFIENNLKIIRELATKSILDKQKEYKRYNDHNSTSVDFKVGDLVCIKIGTKKKGRSPKFQRKYEGPYPLIERTSPVNFKVGGDKKGKIFHVNRMKIFKKLATREMIDGNNDPNLEKAEDNLDAITEKPENQSQVDNDTRLKKVTFEPEIENERNSEIKIEKHRRYRQRLQFLVEGKWIDSKVIDNEPIETYFKSLSRPATRQRHFKQNW